MTSVGMKPIDLKRLEELAAQGLAGYQIAQALGISYDTLARRLEDTAEIAEALKRGEQAAIGTVENALYRNATEGNNLGAQIFWLKNRSSGKWRDKTEQVIGLTAPADLLDDDALAAIAAGRGAGTSAKAGGSA